MCDASGRLCKGQGGSLAVALMKLKAQGLVAGCSLQDADDSRANKNPTKTECRPGSI